VLGLKESVGCGMWLGQGMRVFLIVFVSDQVLETLVVTFHENSDLDALTAKMGELVLIDESQKAIG
jgi:hypothetical protein